MGTMRGVALITTTPLGIACLALASSQCSLDGEGVLGPGTTLDSGPRTDVQGPPVEAGETSQTDAGPGDVARIDVKVPTDAGADTHDAVATWCSMLSPAPLFCDDFDTDHPVLVPPWDTVVTDAGPIGISGAVAKSLPSSASFMLHAESGCQTTVLTKAFSTTYGTVDLSFDLYPDTGAGEVATLGFPSGYYVDLSFGQSSNEETYVEQDDGKVPSTFDDFSQYPAAGVWVRVGLQVALGSTKAITVTLDGTAVHTTPIDKNKMKDAAGPPTVYLGPTCYNDAPARQLYYDNVVFDAE